MLCVNLHSDFRKVKREQTAVSLWVILILFPFEKIFFYYFHLSCKALSGENIADYYYYDYTSLKIDLCFIPPDLQLLFL